MAQTPVSVSVNISGGGLEFANTIYTVPVGKTAVVKSLFAQSANGGGGQTGVSKLVSGQSFPITYATGNDFTNATGGTEIKNNLLPSPLTLNAGESLQASTGSGGVYAIPSVSTASAFAADGTATSVTQIVYGNSIYMAVGYSTTGAYVATSTDCVTWTQRIAAASLAARFTYVAYTNGIWVAIYQNQSSAVFYSTDNGVSWATASGMAGIIPTMVYGANNQLAIYASNGRLYYSTNGNTWTQSTNFYILTNGNAVRGGGWTGSHWIFNTTYGSLATTDFTNFSRFGGIDGGLGASEYYSIDYSPAYSTYYATRNVSTSNNIFTSTNGLLWTGTTVGTFTPYKIACAGSNTVLIGCTQNSSTTRLRSLNGTTWTARSDVNGWAGPCFGLANGYFMVFNTASADDSFYLSTDPTADSGIFGGSANDFYVSAAAADPVSGKYCAVGYQGSTGSWRAIGGSSTTNAASTWSAMGGVVRDSTNGTPISICYANDGYFYVLSDTGRVYRSTAFNSTWTFQGTTGANGYNSGSAFNIRAVGTSLYVTYQGQNSTIYVGSTANGGTSWSAVSLSSTFNGYYRPTQITRASSHYQEGPGATNGSYYLVMTGGGACTAWNPAGVRSNPVTPPQACGSVQTLNGYTFMYGGNNPTTGTTGVYYSTDVITTYGSYNNLQSTTLGNINTPAMFMTYAGSTYYAQNLASSSTVYSSTNLTTWTGKSLGVSMCGVPVVNINGGFANDGTNMVSWTASGQISNVTKTSNPPAYVYASTITASLVEIS